MRDKYFIETWGLTINYYDELQRVGYNTANTWALSTEYANARHGSYTNSQRMLTPKNILVVVTLCILAFNVTGTEYFQFPENGLYKIYMSKKH